MALTGSIAQTSLTLLAQVAAGGDPDAERRFVTRYGRLVRNLAEANGVLGPDSDDLVQEVMLAAVVALREERYDRDRGRFKAFIGGIVAHKLSDLGRQASVGSALRAVRSGGEALVRGADPTGFRALADSRPTPDEEFWTRFNAEWEKALYDDALDEVRLEVEPLTFQAFDLVANRGLKPAEAGKLLGMRRAAVDTAKSRVLARIREKVRQWQAGPPDRS